MDVKPTSSAAPTRRSSSTPGHRRGREITGIDLNFEEAVRANSFDAWRLLTWADEAGPGFQRDLAHQLWRAHFLEGADIGDPFALATRAALVGLDLETAEALLASTEYADEVRTAGRDRRGARHHPAALRRHRAAVDARRHPLAERLRAGADQIYQEWKAAEGPED